jgi:hypothetical protein
MAIQKHNLIHIGFGQIKTTDGTARIFSANNRCDFYDSGFSYSIGNVVESGSNIYRSLVNANEGNDPANPAFWQVELIGVRDGDIAIAVISGQSDMIQRNGSAWISLAGQPAYTALNDNQSSALEAFSYSATGMRKATIKYTIRRGAYHGKKRSGVYEVMNDGVNVEYSNEFNEIGDDVGVTFSFGISAGNVVVSYTSANQSQAIELAYVINGWT